MKQPKKLSRVYKIILSDNGYNTKDYSLISETKNQFVVINTKTKEQVTFVRNDKDKSFSVL